MITTTHVVTNAFLALRNKGDVPSVLNSGSAKWFVAGGIAPDVGLYVLSAGAAVYFPLVKGWTVQESLQHAFETLFFEDRYWLAIHNTFHSPVVLVALAGFAKLTGRKRLLAFAAGCLLHTVMDIPVHHDDGPLVFFPLDWETRVMSPVSYWDRDHFAKYVAPVDYAVTVLGGAALVRTWLKNRRSS